MRMSLEFLVVGIIILMISLVIFSIFSQHELDIKPPLTFECGEFEEKIIDLGIYPDEDWHHISPYNRTEITYFYEDKSVIDPFTGKKYIGEDAMMFIQIMDISCTTPPHYTSLDFGCDNYKECKFVNNETFECRDMRKCIGFNRIYDCHFYDTESVCTDNLSYAYCDADPETCNEKYGIINVENSYWICQEKDIFGECKIFYHINEGFECIEWETNFIYNDHEPQIAHTTQETFDFREYCFSAIRGEVNRSDIIGCENVCTLSRLTCHGSVEECEGRYA